MKIDLYNIFSEYDGKIPDIKTEKCNTDRITKLTMQKVHEIKKERRGTKRFWIPCIAAALIIITGITSAAFAGELSLFRNILHKTESDIYIPNSLPLIGNDEIKGMERNISEERIAFDGNDSMNVSAVGMYYDHNTLMISLELKINSKITIPSDACIVPYITKKTNGTQKKLPYMSGMANPAMLIKGEDSNTYYATYYLTEQDIAGSTLNICLKNINTLTQLNECQKKLVDLNDRWKKDAKAENMTIDQWKQYWQDNDFDEKTIQASDRFLKETEPILYGTWSADIEIPNDIPEQLTFEKDGFRVTADILSVTVEGEDSSSFTDTILAVTMKDGTTVFNVGDPAKKWILNKKGCSEDKHCEFANIYGNIESYARPYKTEDIADITVYISECDENSFKLNEYVIYSNK